MELSVVLAFYNESAALPLLVPRLKSALDAAGLSYEVILVDDGSTDGGARFIQAMATRDTTLKVLQLSRNFGHHVALSAGLDHAKGKHVVLMDADGQDDPSLIPRFLEVAREGYQVVYARRYARQEPWWKRWAARFYHRLLRRVAAVDIPVDAGIFCLMDRQVVEVLRGCFERHRYLNGLRAWAGFRQQGLDVVRAQRSKDAGTPKYSFVKLMGLSLEGLFSFSYLPLRLATWWGLLLAAAGAGGMAFGGISWIGVALLLGGIQLIALGVLGEYVARIYDEVRGRPLYVVASKVGFGS